MDLLRAAKSGSDWTENELLGFRIYVKEVGAAAFFGGEHLPPPFVPNNLLGNEVPNLTKEEKKFFQYMHMANLGSEESAVGDFAKHLLSMLDYDSGERLLRSRKEMTLYMGGRRVNANADITLMSRDYYLLIVQENRRFGSDDATEPQLIAESIAAFAHNQRIRKSTPGTQLLESEAIPGITMVGSTPIFYRTIVTQSLLNSLVTLSYPTEDTTVFKYIPPVPRPHLYPTQGMVPPENRNVVFQCFEAFKRMIDSASVD